MMHDNPFSDAETARRLTAFRADLARRGLDGAVVAAPENVFYLTGLDHWGYFAPHLLMVPAAGEMALVTRAMEKVTIANQVHNARFAGHGDGETVAAAVGRLLAETGFRAQRIGFEAWSSGLSHGLACELQSLAPAAQWLDVSGLVDELRWVKSPAEQAYMRAAARITDAGAGAAIEAARAGASERSIAAECERAMIEAGGSFPGFGPFIRSTARLGEEHTTWTDQCLAAGDSLFLELSGCVARYHAPLGRLVHIGRAPKETHAMAALTLAAFEAVLGALKEGRRAREVYAAWQQVVDDAGLAHYRRHHCGYLVGIGLPPSWTGGNRVTGLRSDSDIVIRTGMGFHVLSWLMGTGRGDFFISNTVLLADTGPEVLNLTPMQVITR
jgi:Xaa-Pro dipeptidase